MTLEETLKEAYPAGDPSEAARIEARSRMAEAQLRGTRRSLRRRWRFALVGGCLVAVVAISAGPRAYAAYRFEQIAGSMNDVRSAVIEQYDVTSGGERRLAGTTYYQEGQWRIESPTRLQFYKAPFLWIYDPAAKRVTKFRRPNGPFGYNGTGFSVRAMLSDFARWDWKRRIDVGRSSLDGRPVETVTLTDASMGGRMTVLADPESHLPIQFRSETEGRTGWRLTGIAFARFDTPLAPALFAQRYPAGTTAVDDERRREEWRRKIETPVAVLGGTSKPVAIREVTVNARGHVFVIFTDGETRKDRAAETEQSKRFSQTGDPSMVLHHYPHPKLTLVDSRGRQYLPSNETLQPFIDSFTPGQASGIVLADGQLLQGAWFIPEDEGEWTPRKLTVRVAGKSEGYSWSVRQPEPDLVPAWMPLIAMGPQDEAGILSGERATLRQRDTEAGDWAKVEASLRAELAHILEQERKGEHYAKQGIYLDLYRALKQTGKIEEARKYLRLAAEEPTRGYEADQIDRAMKTEGLR